MRNIGKIFSELFKTFPVPPQRKKSTTQIFHRRFDRYLCKGLSGKRSNPSLTLLPGDELTSFNTPVTSMHERKLKLLQALKGM